MVICGTSVGRMLLEIIKPAKLLLTSRHLIDYEGLVLVNDNQSRKLRLS